MKKPPYDELAEELWEIAQERYVKPSYTEIWSPYFRPNPQKLRFVGDLTSASESLEDLCFRLGKIDADGWVIAEISHERTNGETKP